MVLSRWAACCLFALIVAGPCPAQGSLPPAPVPVPYGAPPPPPPPPLPLPEPTPAPWPGWYAGADVAVLFPSADIRFTGRGRFDLDAGVSPETWLGYRFDSGGELRLTYRNLESTGNDLVGLDDGGQQQVHLGLDVHWLDLDYVSCEYRFWDGGRFAWEAGGRVAFRDLEARATDVSGALTVKTDYVGGGPHLGVDAAWLFADSGFALFTRLDGAVLFGGDRSRGQVQVAGPFPGTFGLPRERRSETEADVDFRLGLSWERSFGCRWLRAEGGLQAEGWGFGDRDRPAFPFRSVGTVGPFLGVEVGF